MNIYKITPEDSQDILWLVSNMSDFVVHRGSYFVHTELSLSTIKRRFRKEGYDVLISPLKKGEDEKNYPEMVAVWALNDGSKKALDYLKENKEEIDKKILNYVIDSINDILKDVEDMKGG